MTDKILEVRGLTKTYGGEKLKGDKKATPTLDVLKGIDIDIYRGDVVCLIGPSGGGKSTFLRCLNRLEIPTGGSIKFAGIEVDDAHIAAVRQKMGMVFQHVHLFPHLTIRKNITLAPVKLKRMTQAEADQKAAELLEKVGLSDKANQYPNQLSGGQKQRVAMARMLAAEPELILLDEPFSALDTYLKWQLEQEMYKHLKEAGKPVIFVSHNRDEVYRRCDTVSCMNRGKMEVMEPLKEFFQNPKTRTAAILSGCKNISAAERVDAHTLRAVDWGVTLHVKEREIADDIRAVGIRAHFLATVERPGEENVFPVNESEIWEDPFEWNISFRKNAECSWLQWKIAKTDWSPEMGIPKELYLKEEDILLLTDS